MRFNYGSQSVTHFDFLGIQIFGVVGIGLDLQRHVVYNLQTIPDQTRALLGVVANQSHLLHTQIAQNLRPYTIVPLVHVETQL